MVILFFSMAFDVLIAIAKNIYMWTKQYKNIQHKSKIDANFRCKSGQSGQPSTFQVIIKVKWTLNNNNNNRRKRLSELKHWSTICPTSGHTQISDAKTPACFNFPVQFSTELSSTMAEVHQDWLSSCELDLNVLNMSTELVGKYDQFIIWCKNNV